MDILVNVINQKLKIATNLKNFVAGSQNFIRFVFNLSNDWDDLRTFAQFSQNGKSYNQYLDKENSAYLPPEIKAGICTMMLYGSGGTVRCPTNYLTLTIDENMLVSDAQSTEISTSLYEQLVSRVNDLENNLGSSEAIEKVITQAVKDELAAYLADGSLSNMTIEDGSITRNKVNAEFEETLTKADSAMQPSVYDTKGLKTDIYTYTQNAVKDVEDDVSAIGAELSEAYKFSDDKTYSNLKETILGAVSSANKYTDSSLSSYKSFEIKIVDSLPEYGEDMTFYLIPNESGTRYEKYWWITETKENYAEKKWDVFGGSSTLVLDELPEVGEDEVDYILKSQNGCLYYKWIDDSWHIVVGSLAVVLTQLPESGNEYTDYYVLNNVGDYIHYRFIDNVFYEIGSKTYTKSELDSIFAEYDQNILDITNSVNTQNGKIDIISAELELLGNLVSDVTESESGISVYYKDGSSKNVDTKDLTVKVEDVNKSETGLSIIYTDGSTKDIEISGGGGASTSGSASIIRVTESATQCVYGDNCPITFVFNAIDSAGDIVGDGTATWYVGNIKKTTSIAHQGENTFDIGSYLSVGSNNVKVSISVDTGGESPVVTTKTWTVNAINMYVVWDYDDTTINTSDTVAIRWTPYGELLKTTHIIIDGTEVETSETTRSGVMQYVTINKYPHGSHLVEIYLTATVNDVEIRSDSVFHDMIFSDVSSEVPIISCPISSAEIMQYNTIRIPVVIYDPKSLTTDAVLSVDGVEIAAWDNIDRTRQYWNYTPNDFGKKELTITCGETVKPISISVTELVIDNEEISGYAFKLKSSDLASNEALQSWTSNDVSLEFSNNFDWNNGGIKTETDENGNIRQYICIKAGNYMTLNYKLFGNDAKISGKSFKVIFKVMNSRDYDAKFLSCMDSGIGIELMANGGVVSSEQNTLQIHYSEDSYVEFEYDIYPDTTYRYMQTYLDGVLTGTNIYAEGDNFTQTNKQNIIIGSADCDVYIYLVKAYETYLTRDNHIENFIADAPNAQEMVARYERNDVLNDSGEISYEKLAKKNPNCRVHLWSIPRMTEGKKDYVEGCSYQQIYQAGDARHQLTAENVTINIQGTSSVDYKDSGANTDGNFTEGFTDGNGAHIDTYSMSDNSIGVNYFNTKVNIASCENINNMCLAEWYNRYQPYKTSYRIKNEKARDCMEHHIGVQFIHDQSHNLFDDDNYHMYAICNMGNSKNNAEVFHDTGNPLECCIETKDNNSTHCMMLDETFSVADLDSEDYFEFRYPENPTDEIKNAFIDLVRWFARNNPAAATGEALDTEIEFEPYTFVGTGQENEVLVGLTISDYAGTYTHDTYKYRMAKMLSECEDHLIMDAMVYHYVFIEQHAMVDNACKNIFWGTEDLVHWHLAKNYDNDTADGNNNTGKLVIPFGSEGYDDLGDKPVFNGRDNVYFAFIYGLYEARRLMWTNRENAGAWNADAYLAFAKERQNIIPERVYNQDYWYKYLRLYEQESVTTYIPMLEGGKKSHQRAAFVKNNFYYMASQYMGTACTSRSITLRGYTPSEWSGVQPEAKIVVMLYNKGYIVTQIGSAFKRVKAEKGIYYTITFPESGNMSDTVINIHGANLVQAIGDISCLYVGRCDFSNAPKIRSLQIGSEADGYRNENLTEISFGQSSMLEYLYIQNCPSIKSTLDLSGCLSLKELDIRGSGFTGITFAVGGLLEKALLCSPAALTMRYLYYITDENFILESYDNLTTIRLEECNGIDSYAMVNKSSNLNRVRILGIDWFVPETSTLNRLLEIGGLDENHRNVDVSVLSGSVYISGQVRELELSNYREAWQNLTVNYNDDYIVPQWLATYVNANGDFLYSVYIDQGSAPIDPVATGKIDTPTLESTAEHDFTYIGWKNIEGVMTEPRTITADYMSITRKYTVTWWVREGVKWDTVTVEYGNEAVCQKGDPFRRDEEGSLIYNVFSGWDKSTGYITSDIDVYAKWNRAKYPSLGKDLSEMSVAEIYGIATTRESDSFFEVKDYYDIVLGQDFYFSNVESEVLAEDLYLDGSTAKNTGIKLFDANERSFTIAIDFQFLDTKNDSTLLACYETEGAKGFRLNYSNSAPNIHWGDTNFNVGHSTLRDIVVLRHLKGEEKLYIYSSNGNSLTFANSVIKKELIRAAFTSSEAYLVLGAVHYLGDNGYGSYGRGMIHWCKIWYDDLGDSNASALASWYHEKVRLEYCGGNRYLYDESASTMNSISFIANNLLSGRGYPMNSNSTATNVGGWLESDMNTFCDTRLYNALPTEWRSIVNQVVISSSIGNGSLTISKSKDYIYLPSHNELSNIGTSPYSNEGEHISFFSTATARAKFKGRIIPDGATYYTGSSDPSASSANNVQPGDIWKTNTNCYMYVAQSEVDQYNLVVDYTASIGGGWISSNEWWTRSPYYPTTSTQNSSSYFTYCKKDGGITLASAYSVYGICLCLSI